MKAIIATLLLSFFWAGGVFAYVSPGKPTGFVNDFAGVISPEAKMALERELAAFAKGDNPEVVVATIKTLEGDPIEEYANRLFREWGIGDKTKNNGVLFLVAVDDRKMRIEVGYGLEGALTDIESKHIQDDRVRPYFGNSDFTGGIREGVTTITQALQEELVPAEPKKRGPSARQMETYLLLGLIGVSWLASILGRSKSWWAGGLIGGVAGLTTWLVTSWLYWIPIAAAAGLLFDYFVSKNYRAHLSDHHPAWWAGGSWGGWDRWGGGGFGGFGGGSSGGGGSSSNW